MSKQSGQSLQEIGITLGLVALIAIPTLTLLGGQVNNSLNAVNNNSGELNQLAGLLGAPNGGASQQQGPERGILLTGQNQIKLGPNNLTFATDPNNGKLLFTTTSQDGTNTTSIEGSTVMSDLAKELTALSDSQTLQSLPKNVQETIKQLSETAASIAEAEKDIETFTLDLGESGNILAEPVQDYGALSRKYHQFGEQMEQLGKTGLADSNPALLEKLKGLVGLGQNIAYYNYLQPSSVDAWIAEKNIPVRQNAKQPNPIATIAKNATAPPVTLADLSTSAGSQETQAISTEIGKMAPGG